MATCREAYRYICDNLDQHLDSPRCREIKRHLAECPYCRAYLQTVKKTVSLFQLMPVPRIPPGTHGVVVRAIDGLRSSGRKPPARRSSRRQR